MDLSINSKIAIITAGAKSDISDNDAFGKVYIPYELYEQHKEFFLNDLSIFVTGLDDDLSRHQCFIKPEFTNLHEIINTVKDPDTFGPNTANISHIIRHNISKGLGLDKYQIDLFDLMMGRFSTSSVDYIEQYLLDPDESIDPKKFKIKCDFNFVKSTKLIKDEIKQLYDSIKINKKKHEDGEISIQDMSIYTSIAQIKIDTLKWSIHQDIMEVL